MKTIKAVITWVVLIMAILQGPLLYYYCNGFSAIVVLYPYMLIGIILSIFLLFKLRHKASNTPFIKVGSIVGILLAILSSFSEDIIEKIDWKLRRGTRDRIVAQVRDGSFEGGQVEGWYFPPISNGENFVVVSKITDTTFKVEFYINSGFLDHYSAFVYTNDTEAQKGIEDWIADGKRFGFKKLDTNWYRVSY